MRYGVLGPVTAAAEGRVISLPAPRVRGLLGLLLVEAERSVSDTRIIDVLWGDEPPRTARASVHNHVMRLRRALGDADAATVRRTHDGYEIAVGDGQLDLTEFEALRQRGAEALAAGRWAAAESSLAEALALWRGEPLADVPSAVRDAIGLDRISEAGLQAREQLARSRLQLGRFGQVVSDIEPLVRTHPWRESFVGLLMQALYGTGRQAEALSAYRDLRTRLIAELGVEPSADIRDLLQRILREEPGIRTSVEGASRTASDGTGFAGTPVGVRTTAGPPVSRRVKVPAHLPADVADFTGRSALTEELIRVLSDSTAANAEPRPLAVAAITGTGGVGKTSLALHAAHRLAAGFSDGQLFVDLGGATAAPRSPADVLDELLVALGLPEHELPTTFEARVAEFRSQTSGRRLLVVLDDARDAAQIRPLLPGSGSCGVLVTSRNRLPGLAAAVPLQLDVMGPAEGRALFAAIVGRERADAEPGARDEILEYCAGLPLAIRIAASRLASRPSWSVGDLAARLRDERDRLDELSVEDVAVRASFQVGYLNLNDPGQAGGDHRARAFRLLGLWPGEDLSLGAIAALLGTSGAQAGRLMESLTDAHLVDTRVAGRYRLHDLLRIYARERVESEETPDASADALGRLFAWYTHAAAAAADQYLPARIRRGLDRVPMSAKALTFADLDEAQDWFRAERVNLRVAVELAGEQPGNAAAWVLALQLKEIYALCALWADLEQTHTIGLRVADRLNDPQAQSTMYAGLSTALRNLARREEGLEAARLAYERAVTAADPILTMTTMSNVAVALSGVGRNDEAAGWHAKSLPAIRDAGHPGLLAHSLINAGKCYFDAGAYTDAAAAFTEASTAAAATETRYQETAALLGLADSQCRLDDGPSAVLTLRRALELTQATCDRSDAARCHDRLGDALLMCGEPDAAHEAWREAVRLWGDADNDEAQAMRAKLAAADARLRLSDAGLPADELTPDIEVAVVAGDLLDQVEDHPSEVDVAAVADGALGR